MGNTLVFQVPSKSSYTDVTYQNVLCYIPKSYFPGGMAPGVIPCIYLKKDEGHHRHVGGMTNNYLFIAFHGNSEDIGMAFSFGHCLHDRLGVDVALIEYPGYGIYTSEQPSESKLLNDAEAALTFFTNGAAGKVYHRRNIILLGRSLGSAVAIDLASKYPDLGGMVLISPFTSIQEVAAEKAGSILAKLVPSVFDNKTKVKYVNSPTLIIHGEKDTVVPYSHSQTLYKLCATPLKMLKILPNFGHNFADDEKDIHANIFEFASHYWPDIARKPKFGGHSQLSQNQNYHAPHHQSSQHIGGFKPQYLHQSQPVGHHQPASQPQLQSPMVSHGQATRAPLQRILSPQGNRQPYPSTSKLPIQSHAPVAAKYGLSSPTGVSGGTYSAENNYVSQPRLMSVYTSQIENRHYAVPPQSATVHRPPQQGGIGISSPIGYKAHVGAGAQKFGFY